MTDFGTGVLAIVQIVGIITFGFIVCFIAKKVTDSIK